MIFGKGTPSLPTSNLQVYLRNEGLASLSNVLDIARCLAEIVEEISASGFMYFPSLEPTNIIILQNKVWYTFMLYYTIDIEIILVLL